jgi:hypothetical protein
VAEASRIGLRRDPVAFVRFDPSGALVDTVGLFPGRDVYLTEEGGRGVMSTPPFARNSVGGIWSGGILVGINDSFELLELTTAGDTTRIFRIPEMDLDLRSGHREEYLAGRLGAVPPEERPELRSALEAMPFPQRRPAYGGILVDETGNLWVSEWALTPRVPGGWNVLDSQGRWLGRVEVPERFAPLQVGENWVLGMESDEMEVEYVAVYPLWRGPDAQE